MKKEELYYLMALLRVDRVGDMVAKKLLRHFVSPKDIFTASSQQLKNVEGISDTLVRNIKKFNRFALVDKEFEFVEKHQIQIISIFDPNYPYLLQQCPDAPLVLFYKGIDFSSYDNMLSIVGTRNITSNGISFIKETIQNIREYNPTIVSGYAFGADIHAHLSAIDNGLKTLAVLGHGLQHTYPAMHKKYNAKIIENGGFLTEFWSTDSINKENFVRRNRIVAGLSSGTVVVESAIKGGSLSTARLANDYNREVMAVPGRISDPYSAGCNHLIKTNQAHLINSADDIVFQMGWESPVATKPKTIQPQLFVELNEDEQLIADYFANKEKELLDVISIDTKIPVHQLMVLLFNLEMKGLVKPMQGKYYQWSH